MIKINGENWRISLVSPNHPALRMPNGVVTLGCCDDLLKTIFINGTLNELYLKKVLCHELVHAYVYSYNIKLSDYQEELLADFIATHGKNIIEATDSLYRNNNKGNLY